MIVFYVKFEFFYDFIMFLICLAFWQEKMPLTFIRSLWYFYCNQWKSGLKLVHVQV